MKELQEEIGEFDKLKAELEKLNTKEKIEEFERKLKEKEFQIFLSGKYDRNNAILSIYAGAGGQDSQDWATMLLRMYERYCQKKDIKLRCCINLLARPGDRKEELEQSQLPWRLKDPFPMAF